MSKISKYQQLKRLQYDSKLGSFNRLDYSRTKSYKKKKK